MCVTHPILELARVYPPLELGCGVLPETHSASMDIGCPLTSATCVFLKLLTFLVFELELRVSVQRLAVVVDLGHTRLLVM